MVGIKGKGDFVERKFKKGDLICFNLSVDLHQHLDSCNLNDSFKAGLTYEIINIIKGVDFPYQIQNKDVFLELCEEEIYLAKEHKFNNFLKNFLDSEQE